MTTAANQLSFLPEDFHHRKHRKRAGVICVTLFLVVMAAIAGTFMLSERVTNAMVRQDAEVDQQYTDAAKKLEQLKEMQEKQKRMVHQAELTASLLEKIPRSRLLAEITNSLPTGVSLIDLAMDSKARAPVVAPVPKTQFEQRKAELDAKNKPAAPVQQVKVYDVTLKLTGVAANDEQVAQFISRLSKSKLLKDVNLDIIDQFLIDKAMVRRFQLNMQLNPEANSETK